MILICALTKNNPPFSKAISKFTLTHKLIEMHIWETVKKWFAHILSECPFKAWRYRFAISWLKIMESVNENRELVHHVNKLISNVKIFL